MDANNIDDLELSAYRLIRRRARSAASPASSEELGEYVRGVVDMQTEIYKALLNTPKDN